MEGGGKQRKSTFLVKDKNQSSGMTQMDCNGSGTADSIRLEVIVVLYDCISLGSTAIAFRRYYYYTCSLSTFTFTVLLCHKAQIQLSHVHHIFSSSVSISMTSTIRPYCHSLLAWNITELQSSIMLLNLFVSQIGSA